jgi:hypothetical protein
MRQQSGLFRGAMRSVFADTPACGDSSVDPSDGLLRVVDKILARKAGVNTLANWPA